MLPLPHITTANLCIQVTNLRARGLQFLDVPDKYYTNLRERLKQSPVDVREDIDMVRCTNCDFVQ